MAALTILSLNYTLTAVIIGFWILLSCVLDKNKHNNNHSD